MQNNNITCTAYINKQRTLSCLERLEKKPRNLFKMGNSIIAVNSISWISMLSFSTVKNEKKALHEQLF